jgi:hypothetical protein
LRHWINIPIAIAVGACTYLLMVRVTSLISTEERERLLHLASTAPVFERAAVWVTNFLSPRENEISTPAEVLP